jgi:hypothetical protein
MNTAVQHHATLRSGTAVLCCAVLCCAHLYVHAGELQVLFRCVQQLDPEQHTHTVRSQPAPARPLLLPCGRWLGSASCLASAQDQQLLLLRARLPHAVTDRQHNVMVSPAAGAGTAAAVTAEAELPSQSATAAPAAAAATSYLQNTSALSSVASSMCTNPPGCRHCGNSSSHKAATTVVSTEHTPSAGWASLCNSCCVAAVHVDTHQLPDHRSWNMC